MKVSVQAIVQNGKLKLEKPISCPDGTKTLVSFFIDTSSQDDAKKWLEQYYQRTKYLILDEEFERNVELASQVINSWQLPARPGSKTV